MGTGLYLALNFIKTSRSIPKKKSAVVILLTGAFSLAAASLTDVVLPRAHIYTIPNLGSFFTLAWALGVVYAMVKYKFLSVTPYTAADNIISAMGDSLILLNENLIIVFINGATSDLLGYRSHELIGKRLEVLLPESLKFDQLNSVLQKQNIRDEDFYLKTKKGHVVPAILTVSPLLEVTGEAIGAVCIAKDISGRKKTEKKLLQLSRAVEDSPASIVITDSKGTIEYVNTKFIDITGYSFSEAVGQNPRILKSGEQPPEFYKNLWDTINKGNVWRGELHNKKKNGELYWESASISPLKDPDGHMTHFVGIKEDITERKRVGEALKNAYDELKQAQLQLVQSAKMASIGLLAVGVAHEINNPLAVISGESYMLFKDENKDQETRDSSKTIFEQTQRIQEITGRLLEFSRRKEFERRLLDVNQDIEKSIALLTYQIKIEKIAVVKEIQHGAATNSGR